MEKKCVKITESQSVEEEYRFDLNAIARLENVIYSLDNKTLDKLIFLLDVSEVYSDNAVFNIRNLYIIQFNLVFIGVNIILSFSWCPPHETYFCKIGRTKRLTRKQILQENQRLLEEKIKIEREDGLKVVNSNEKGRGVATIKEFKRGEFVAEYTGELIDSDVAKKREDQYAKNDSTGSYMYFFEYNCRKYCIDSTEETKRFGRLINHSKFGNLAPKTVVIDGYPHLIFFASRDILPNEELLYDYGDRRYKALQAHPWLGK